MLAKILRRTAFAVVRTSQFRGMATRPLDNAVDIKGASASVGEKYVSVKLSNGSTVYVIDKKPSTEESQ